MDLSSFGLGNADLLQTMAALQWASNGDKAMFEKIATFRVGQDLFTTFGNLMNSTPGD